MGVASSVALSMRDAVPSDALAITSGVQSGAAALIVSLAASVKPFCFARKPGDRAFDEAHGFRPVACRDGAANEEGEPDIVTVRDAGPVLTLPREDMP